MMASRAWGRTLRVAGHLYDLVTAAENRDRRRPEDPRRPEPRASGERVHFTSALAARRLLAQFGHSGAPKSELRAFLARRVSAGVVSRLTDDEVIDELARRLATSDLHVYALAAPRPLRFKEIESDEDEVQREPDAVEEEEYLDAGIAADAEPEEFDAFVEADPEPEELEAVVEADPEPDELEARIGPPPDRAPPPFEDPAAQAAALREAASDGAPFCEECEKAKKAQADAAAEARPSPVDAPAQAAVLKQAAAEGAPFCEECEKAKKKKAAAPPAPSDADAIDAPAQAATLTTAAARGAPYCEECEKAKKRLAEMSAEAGAKGAAVPAVDAAADAERVDAPAQAATMQTAAKSGAPFCEECEKAKREAAAAASH